jgi:PAS domain-containing protein
MLNRPADTNMKSVSTEDLRVENPLLDVFSDPIVGLDNARRIVIWNAAAEAEYGFAREEAIGRLGDELLQTGYELALVEILETL